MATAFTVKVQDSLNMWLILFQLLTVFLSQSQKSHSILTIFQLVTGSNFTVVGKPVLIASIFIKKLKPGSQLSKGVLSKLLSHKDITMWLLSSTIHIEFFSQSQSISSSHTFQIQSQSKSYWFKLNTYGQLSFPFVNQSQS